MAVCWRWARPSSTARRTSSAAWPAGGRRCSASSRSPSSPGWWRCSRCSPGSGGPATAADLGWGAGAGLLGATGLVVFFRALSGGVMSVIAPVTAVTAAAVPVLAGLLGGNRIGRAAGRRHPARAGRRRPGLRRGRPRSAAGRAPGQPGRAAGRRARRSGSSSCCSTARPPTPGSRRWSRRGWRRSLLVVVVALAGRRSLRVGRAALPLVLASGRRRHDRERPVPARHPAGRAARDHRRPRLALPGQHGGAGAGGAARAARRRPGRRAGRRASPPSSSSRCPADAAPPLGWSRHGLGFRTGPFPPMAGRGGLPGPRRQRARGSAAPRGRAQRVPADRRARHRTRGRLRGARPRPARARCSGPTCCSPPPARPAGSPSWTRSAAPPPSAAPSRRACWRPLTVFVNVEPEVLDTAPLDDLLAIAADAPGELRARPGDHRARARRPAGGAAAHRRAGPRARLGRRPRRRRRGLDVAGVHAAAAPRRRQARPAAGAGAPRPRDRRDHERGQRLRRADRRGRAGRGHRDRGAPRHGPGAGRDASARAGCSAAPVRAPAPGLVAGELGPARASASAPSPTRSPFGCLPARRRLRRVAEGAADRAEQAARARGDAPGRDRRRRRDVPGGPPLHARRPTQRYRDLVERTGFVCALGEGLPVEPLPGLRGADLRPDDAGARRVGRRRPRPALQRRAAGPRPRRRAARTWSARFEYALTYDRDHRRAGGARAAVAGRPAGRRRRAAVAVRRPAAAAAGRTARCRSTATRCCATALAATTSGVTIADMRQPDQPLVYVNAAFEELAGFPRREVLGRNCRFLQSPDTDPAAVARIRAAIDRGEECRETVLNLRGPDRTPWWNEIHLSPVVDDAGTVVAVHRRAARRHRPGRGRAGPAAGARPHPAVPGPDRGAGLHRPADRPAQPPPAARSRSRRRSGRPGRRTDAVGAAVRRPRRLQGGQRRARPRGRRRAAAGGGPQRLRGRLRRSDLLARLGGDEFLVGAARPGPGDGRARGPPGRRRAAAAVRAPVPLRGQERGGRREHRRGGLPRRRRGVRPRCCTPPTLGMYAHKAGTPPRVR